MEVEFKASVVRLIMSGRAEEALVLLARHYKVSSPRLKVGLPKRHRKGVLGCYVSRKRTVSVINSDVLKDPSVILHEFYHHLRTSIDRKHRGNEKYAREFAMSFIKAYNAQAACLF